MEDKLKVGDFVDVYFENIPWEPSCEILHIPCATGDSWGLRSKDGGIIAVQSYSKMVQLNGPPTPKE